MFKFFYLLIFVLCSSLASSSENKLYFIEPKDGATVNGPIKIVFGLSGMGVAPAGIDFPNTGHHHLLVDLENLPDLSKPIPANKNHIHFGKGQTEAILELPKGKRTLQLLMGNYLHIPHKEPVISDKITIFIK